MSSPVRIFVNGEAVSVPPMATVAVAVMIAGRSSFRTSVSGEMRGPLCGMGICFECRMKINGKPHVKSCQVICTDGIEIESDD